MATIQDNDDLLILSENDNDDTTLVLDEENVVSDNNDLITFDTEDNTKVEEVKEESIDNGFSFDIDEDTKEESITENKKEESISIETDDSTFDFGLSNEKEEDKSDELVKDEVSTDIDTSFDLSDVSEENSLDMTSKNEEVWTMSDILDRTISELNSRDEKITDEVSKEETYISDIKEQISDLEAKVSDSEEKVSTLNSEKDLISKNIKSLEKMKNVNVTTEIKTETSAKVHNVKRQKAA